MGTSEACMHLLSGSGICYPNRGWLKDSRVKRFRMGISIYPRVQSRLFSGVAVRKVDKLSCKCLRDERNVGAALSGLDGALPGSTNGSVTSSVDQVLSGKSENVSKSKIDLMEEEAWDLLRDSIVNYCGNPVGTIAANEPNSSDFLNYDQVFIRDFVPSGIAFLLKGEYDIVRNFILHTLQLQVKYDFWCFNV